MTWWLVVGTALAVVALLVAERRDAAWRRPIKAIASAGFIALAVTSGALDSGYGRLLLVGLCLAWVGDLALTYRGRQAFLVGLGAFLAGHVAYVAAFEVRGVHWPIAAIGSIGVVLTAGPVWRWLRPHLVPEMVGPVAAYVAVISLMVAGALGTTGVDFDIRIPAGAGAFFASDVAVARERFVAPGFVNRAWGLPAYYLGQILLALSVAR